MKKIFYSLFVLTTIVLFSCTKDHVHQSRLITIDTTLASGTEYQLNLQPYGDNDDIATITKQATNFTTSNIVNSGSGFAPVYHFSAVTSESSTLNEQVVISITEGNRGGSSNNIHRNCDSTLVTINFKVQ